MLFAMHVHSQSANNDAIVTIVGNPVDNTDNNSNQFANSNSVNQSNLPPPPAQQEYAPIEQNIEPTLENGFHMRFQLESPGSVERMNTINNSGSATTYAPGSSGYSGTSGAKVKRHSATIAERSFNFKKKMKTVLPKRKKKYHPTLCEKFR